VPSGVPIVVHTLYTSPRIGEDNSKEQSVHPNV
jgi:hypothetical protein